MDVEIHVSPRMFCPCGKTAMTLTPEQRVAYDTAMRRLAERAETKQEEPSIAAHDAMVARTSDGQSDSSDDARELLSTPQ